MTGLFEKSELQRFIINSLEEELASILKSAEAAYQGATHEEAVSKSKYETHGLELSYLAGSQFERARILKQQILSLSSKQLKKFSDQDEVALEALVTVQSAQKKQYHYFISSIGAGLKLECQGKSIQVISPESAIGNELIGSFSNDVVFIERAGKLEEWELVAVS